MSFLGEYEDLKVTCCVCCVCVSGPRLASRLRMFLSDICSRTATGGIRAMVAGRRVTSAFMSLSSSSNCFSTATRGTKREVLRCPGHLNAKGLLWANQTCSCTLSYKCDFIFIQWMRTLRRSSSPLCRTAFAGLFPDMDSLLRCWWDSARHSTSLKRVLRAMEGWEGSSVMLR